MTRQEATELAQQFQGIDIEGYLNEMIDWLEDEKLQNNFAAQEIIALALDIFAQYLED